MILRTILNQLIFTPLLAFVLIFVSTAQIYATQDGEQEKEDAVPHSHILVDTQHVCWNLHYRKLGENSKSQYAVDCDDNNKAEAYALADQYKGYGLKIACSIDPNALPQIYYLSFNQVIDIPEESDKIYSSFKRFLKVSVGLSHQDLAHSINCFTGHLPDSIHLCTSDGESEILLNISHSDGIKNLFNHLLEKGLITKQFVDHYQPMVSNHFVHAFTDP